MCIRDRVPEVPVPQEVYDKDVNRVIGLTCRPRKLISIREERLRSLGLSQGAKYADIERIREELMYADEVMRKLGCVVIDVTDKAIEETAEIVLDHMKSVGL